MQLIFDADTPVTLVQKMPLVRASPVSENILTDAAIEIPDSSDKSDIVPRKHKTDVDGAIKVMAEMEKVANGVLEDTELPSDDARDKEDQENCKELAMKKDNIENDLQEDKSDLMDFSVEEEIESLNEVNKSYMEVQNDEMDPETDIDHEPVSIKNGGFEGDAIRSGREAVTIDSSKNPNMEIKNKCIEAKLTEVTDMNISFSENDLVEDSITSSNEKAEDGSEEAPDKCDPDDLNEDDLLQEYCDNSDKNKEEDCYIKLSDLNEEDLLKEGHCDSNDKGEKNAYKSVPDRAKSLQDNDNLMDVELEKQGLKSAQQETINENHVGHNDLDGCEKSSAYHVTASNESITDSDRYVSTTTGDLSADDESMVGVDHAPSVSSSDFSTNDKTVTDQLTTTTGAVADDDPKASSSTGDFSDIDPNPSTTTGDLSADESIDAIDPTPSISTSDVGAADKTMADRSSATADGVSDDNYPKACVTTGEFSDKDPSPSTTTCEVSADNEPINETVPTRSVSTSDAGAIDETIADPPPTAAGGVSGDNYPKASASTTGVVGENDLNPSANTGKVGASDENSIENQCNVTGVIADEEIKVGDDCIIKSINEMDRLQESTGPAKEAETIRINEISSHSTADVRLDEEGQNRSSVASEGSLEDFIKNTSVNEDAALAKVNLCTQASEEVIQPVNELMDISNTGIEDLDNAEIVNKSVDTADKDDDKSRETSKLTKTVSGLANNLEIFSDEEDDTCSSKKFTIENKSKSSAEHVEQNEDCVSLDDDDDIMVIDDDTNSKTDKTEGDFKPIKDIDNIAEPSKLPPSEKSPSPKSDITSTDASEATLEKCDKKTSNEEKIENIPESAEKTADRPLVSPDFLTNFKMKMGEMTRTDLEEFCLLKIVEGVIDRSNLSEIKAKLKTMMQNVEEWRKKSMVLNKQNRDLQIVLRTIQEEQRKRTDEAITPLKITRSVGMQVLMGDGKMEILQRIRNPKRASPGNAPPPKTTLNKAQGRNQKPTIPVPRLVPASPTKPVAVKGSPQLQNSTVTSNSGSGKASTPNGVKAFTPIKVAEKRSYSDSIDLTDDEPAPPAKKAPVRLVPSQQLMAPGRASFGNNSPKNSTPRHVYIPIGSQNIVRPGQTMLIKNGAQGGRPRAPAPGAIVRGVSPGTRPNMVRGQSKHPAPLPQAYSQPQPPNWKALPPAPDLKISKIENGIVVSWKIDGYQESSYEEIVSYQLYAYQETSQPASTLLWNKIGDIKALPLPMACTLTQFIAGYKYYFAVRAVDKRSRIGPFSLPGSILLLNK